MEKETCEACGYKSKPGSLVVHFIVPQDTTKQAGMPCPRSVTLCTKCSNELHNWYSKKVFNMSYDPGNKRFIPRPPADMVKEYEAAFKAFITYKNNSRERLN